MAATGTLTLNSSIRNTNTNFDLSVPFESVSQTGTKTISTGQLYHDTVDLTADEVYSLDFADSSLTDVYGNALALSGITSLYLKAGSTNTTDIVVSGAVNSMLNTQPALGASEALGFLSDIDITTDSKLYFINGAVSGSIDIVVTGD